MSLRDVSAEYCPHLLKPIVERIHNSPLAMRLARGTFWILCGAMISRGSMLVASIFVARILGRTTFGEFGMIRYTISTIGVFAGFGLGQTATKYVAELHKKDTLRTGRIIALSEVFAVGLSLIVSVVLVALAPWLAVRTINAPHLTHLLQIGALILFFESVTGAQTGILAGLEAFKSIAQINVIVGLLSLPGIVMGAYFYGLIGAICAVGISLCVNAFLNHQSIRIECRRRNLNPDFKGCMSEWKLITKYSVPAALTSIMMGPTNWICASFLVNHPGGYDQMGVLSAANQLSTVVLFLPGMLGQALMPLLSEQLGDNNKTKSRRLLMAAIKLNLLIVIPPITLGIMLSRFVMGIYGKGFVDGWSTLAIVLLTSGLMAFRDPAKQSMAASGFMWVDFVMNSVWACICIVLSTMLVAYGALGIAIARAIAFSIHLFWLLGFTYWMLKENEQVSRIALR